MALPSNGEHPLYRGLWGVTGGRWAPFASCLHNLASLFVRGKKTPPTCTRFWDYFDWGLPTCVKSLNSSEQFNDYWVEEELFFPFHRKGYFHVNTCFQKAQGSPYPQPGLPRTLLKQVSKWWRNYSDVEGVVRSPRGLISGPLFQNQNHLLVRFTSCLGFLKGDCLTRPVISGSTFLRSRK